jgi:hypothetical protein
MHGFSRVRAPIPNLYIACVWVPGKLGHNLSCVSFIFLLVPSRVDPDVDGEFRLCVQFSPFTAKLDDGCSVHMLRKCDEWVVDCRFYNLENALVSFNLLQGGNGDSLKLKSTLVSFNLLQLTFLIL